MSLGTARPVTQFHIPEELISEIFLCHDTDRYWQQYLLSSGTGSNNKNLTDMVMFAVYFTVIYCDLE